MRAYLLAFVLTAGPGALMIATMLSSRFLSLSRLPLNTLYTMVTLVVAVVSVFAVRPSYLSPGADVRTLLSGAVIGPMLGHLIVLADGRITEAFRRRSRLRRITAGSGAASQNRRDSAASTYTQVRPSGVARQLAVQRRQPAPRVPAGQVTVNGQPRRHALLWLILVAIGEEVLYRGFFVAWALQFSLASAVCLLALSTGVFALIHISFGWSQVVAKLPLALSSLVSTLVFGSPLCAVLAHVYFNVYYWRKRRFTALSAAATPWSA